MKKLVVTISLVLMVLVGFSQSLRVVDTDHTTRGKIGEEMRLLVKIENTSDRPVTVVAQRVVNQIGSSQSSYFCVENNCFDQTLELSPTFTIQPGEISESFEAVLEAGLSEQYSNVSYKFYDQNFPSDAVNFDIDFVVDESDGRSLIYESTAIVLSDIYPNPVTDKAIIEYNLLDETKEAKMVVHNVLGSVMGEFPMSPVENQLKIPTTEFNPGIYFYTLYVDSKSVATKKLVIKN